MTQKMKAAIRFLAVVLVLCMAFSFAVHAETELPADDPVEEEYVNADRIYANFRIENGQARMSATVSLKTGSTATVYMLLEEQFWFFWPDVDDGEFTDYVSSSGTVTHYVPIESGNTYRATITVTVSGPYGSDDVYEYEQEVDC